VTKALVEAVEAHYPDLDGSIHPVFVDRADGNGIVFDRAAWPAELGTAPTDEQITGWMAE